MVRKLQKYLSEKKFGRKNSKMKGERKTYLKDQGFLPILSDSDVALIFSRKGDACHGGKCRKKKALFFPTLLFYYKGAKENEPCGKLAVDIPVCYLCHEKLSIKKIVETLGGWYELLTPWREDSRLTQFPDLHKTRLVFYNLRERTEPLPSLDEQIEIAKRHRSKIQ